MQKRLSMWYKTLMKVKVTIIVAENCLLGFSGYFSWKGYSKNLRDRIKNKNSWKMNENEKLKWM